MNYRFIIFFLLTIFGFSSFAQSVSGYVKDENGSEIPFANVWLKGTLQGTMADVNGHFAILSPKNDTLCVSSVGYKNRETLIKRKQSNDLVIVLEKEIQKIDEVTVKPEVPRAKVLFKQIVRHKKQNRENLRSITSYKTLAQTTVYRAVDTTWKVTKLINNLNEVTVKIDSQKLRFAPIYLAEEALNFENNEPEKVYNKKDGIFPRLNQSIESLILLNVVIDLDFYKEQIYILGRGIISPISSTAPLHYNLYLNDSTILNGKKYFNFSFAPKNRYNLLFSGHFTVEDSSFALTDIEVYLPKEANLNFINGFKGNVKYKKMPNGTWFYNQQRIGINMSLTLNKDTASNYSSQRIDNVASGNWLINKSTSYSTSEQLTPAKAYEWKNSPEFASDNQLEVGAYYRVDKLKEQNVVKGIDAIGNMVLTSYVNAGKIDIGPVYDIYSTNLIEGNRFNLPLRTSEKMFKYFSVGGYLGMGTKTKELKYGVNFTWQPLTTDKFIFRFYYYNDYYLVSQDKYLRYIKKNPNTRGNGNFIAAFTSREQNPYLKEENSFELRMELNAEKNFTLEASPYYLSSTRTENVHFIRDGTEYETYSNYGVLFNCRLAFGQHYDKLYFDRVYYLNQTPVINLSWDIGQTRLPNGSITDFGIYSQFHGSIEGRLTMGQIFMNYMFNAGYLLGDAPYDLLDQPVGSMSLGYAKYRYNLLHHASFAHNLYTNTHLHFNGGGIILNRIPLIKRLKLREIVSFKLHYGTLNSSYKGVFDLPGYYSNDIKTPYSEIGFGVTNIFKVLRIEYVHLLGNTYSGSSFTDKSGIRLRAEMSF